MRDWRVYLAEIGEFASRALRYRQDLGREAVFTDFMFHEPGRLLENGLSQLSEELLLPSTMGKGCFCPGEIF